jgi:hypothetical protein
MGFKKGQPRPANAGRKKGTPNKSTLMIKLQELNYDVVQKLIDSLEAQPQYMQADHLIKLLEFMYPKKKENTELSIPQLVSAAKVLVGDED